ncbi:hypothetical protein [Chitinilyticum aquatile]|uniref:hypothetical protein n=1 Tax=Chitinilyticum aquatile TaxID=362520 RepID=UPI00048C8FE2|nr:hypothetical protein [Chitinilyticum aquatile]
MSDPIVVSNNSDTANFFNSLKDILSVGVSGYDLYLKKKYPQVAVGDDGKLYIPGQQTTDTTTAPTPGGGNMMLPLLMVGGVVLLVVVLLKD